MFSNFRHPLGGAAFFILVALLSSNFASWGMEGITFAVFIAAGTIIVVPIAVSRAKQSWIAMLHGKRGRMDFLAAPSGYRRARLAESPEEAARQSIVAPTPNRPLLPGDTVEGTTSSKSVRKQLPPAPAWKWGGNPALYMAPDLTIPIDLFIGHAVAGIGMRGSGKTSLAARLIEQLARFPIPMLIGDYEEDYRSLPTLLERCVIAGAPGWSGAGQYEGYYWEVDQTNARGIGEYLLEVGHQVVLMLRSYETKEEAAIVFVKIIRGLFKWADEHPEGRVPCLVFLDEAQHFLPENGSVSNIGKDELSLLLGAFDDLNARGRKRGLTPCLFTQRIAQIKKSAIAGSEIWFMGKQQLPNDLERYEEFVGRDEQGKQIVNRRVMQTLDAGTFYVFEDGEFYPISFWNRDTEHRGKTPSFQDAMDRYGSTEVSREAPVVDTDYSLKDWERDHAERDQELEVELEDDDDPLNNVRTRAAQPTVTPVVTDERKAEDIDINVAIVAYNAGHTSRHQLARQFGLGESQGRKLKDKIERIAKEKQTSGQAS